MSSYKYPKKLKKVITFDISKEEKEYRKKRMEECKDAYKNYDRKEIKEFFTGYNAKTI